MLKGILCGLAITCISSSVIAETTIQPCNYFTGAYLGAGFSYQANAEKYEGELIQAVNPTFNYVYGGKMSWAENIFLGYGHVIQNFYYLGGEIYGRFNQGKRNLFEAFLPDRFTAVKTPFAYGLTVKFGYLFSPQLLGYVGIGGEYMRVRFVNKTTRLGVLTATYLTDKVEGAFLPSAGFEYAITPNWHLGVDASYAIFRDIDYEDPFTGFVGTFQTARLNIGLNASYHFTNW